jgi:glycosyltransferase involved in cell wall biosynthesis
MPRVSVVMPVHNGARYLAEALESVFAQTFRDFEVIVVDDGSTDETPAILRGYGDRLAVISREQGGACAARNLGVERTAAPYVAFLDHDDRWYPRKLEQQTAVLDARPEVVLVLSESDRMDEQGRLIQTRATAAERPRLKDSPLGRLMETDQLLSSAIMVRREAFVRAGMFDPDLHGFEDFDLCARLRRLGEFAFVEEPGMCYRVHRGSFSRSGGERLQRSRERFLLRMRALFADDGDKQALIRTMLAECYSDWGLSQARAGRTAEGRRKLLEALRYNPFKLRTYLRLARACAMRRGHAG